MEAEPKSPSLTWPGSVNRMFPALTSLWEEEEVVDTQTDRRNRKLKPPRQETIKCSRKKLPVNHIVRMEIC